MITFDRHWLHVSRSFERLRQQLLSLDPSWLEDAIRTAAERTELSPITVRVDRPYQGPETFALPMEWQLEAGPRATVLQGELEAFQEGPAESRIGLWMLPPAGSRPEEEDQLALVRRAVDATTRCFLHRLFWTLEALTRNDLVGEPGADARPR